MRFAICFTNFGPYHLARLRALGQALRANRGELIAYEVAGREQRYPWTPERSAEPFSWRTFFPDSTLEHLNPSACRDAISRHLDQDDPDAVAAVGYARPESLAMLSWARGQSRPCILMSESQSIDKPRVWWKEALKTRRVKRFSSALVGGPAHRDYLIELGMPAERIALGYNAVDHDSIRDQVDQFRNASKIAPVTRPYFLAVNRFVPEKNLERLVRAHAAHRTTLGANKAWDLVLCGDGSERPKLEQLVTRLGLNESVHFPGFLQEKELIPWWAGASAFVHPSLMEPWGLVVNEAAACRLPLLVSTHAGCMETLVPEPSGTTGRRFDPAHDERLTQALNWMACLSTEEREAMGQRAEFNAREWGPARFAQGTLEAIDLALPHAGRRKNSNQVFTMGSV